MESFRGLTSWSLQVAASCLACEEELGPSGAVPLIFLLIGLAHKPVSGPRSWQSTPALLLLLCTCTGKSRVERGSPGLSRAGSATVSSAMNGFKVSEDWNR